MTGAEIKKRYDYLFALRKGSIEQTWTQIEEYISPIRAGRFYQEQTNEYTIQTRRPNVWDLTPIWGAQQLASSMESSLTSPAVRWFKLDFKNKELKKDKDAQIWLDDCSDKMFDAIGESNFYTEGSSMYQDLVCFGTTGLTLETESDLHWNGFDFSCIPVRGLYFEPDHSGHCYRLFRRLEWTASQIIEKWSLDAWNKIPERIKRLDDNGEPTDTKINIIFAVFPRVDILRKHEQEMRKLPKDREPQPEMMAPDLRPWGSKYVLQESGDEIGEEGGYYENPAFVARWEKTSGSMWGHGPGAIAIPTVKYLNNWLETEMSAAEKVVDPATLSTERGVISQLDLTPGGNTVVRSMDDLKPFESAANFPVVDKRLEDLRGMINKVFRVDDLQLKQSPAMTAMEVQVRYELMNRVLGPTVTRLQFELLSPLLKRAFHLMVKHNQFLPPPASVLKLDPHMDIEYSGPLMRAQRADEVGSIERISGLVSALAQGAYPEVVDVLDPVKLIRDVADRLQVPKDILRSDSEIQQLAQARQKAAAMQQQQQAAEVAKTRAMAKKTNAEAEPSGGGAPAPNGAPPPTPQGGQTIFNAAQQTAPDPLGRA